MSLTSRLLIVGLACGVMLGPACGSAAAAEPSAAELMDYLMWNRGPVGGSFDLVDHTGKRRTDSDFRGKLLLVYFGYTYCPDICPTDLQAIGLAVQQLGPVGEAVQPLFISVDPERDTVQHLADYVPLFHPRLIGLTGSADEIRRVANAYKVFYAKVAAPRGDDYAIDHTGFVYLMDAHGQYLGFFPPGTTADRMAEIIRPFLARVPQR